VFHWNLGREARPHTANPFPNFTVNARPASVHTATRTASLTFDDLHRLSPLLLQAFGITPFGHLGPCPCSESTIHIRILLLILWGCPTTTYCMCSLEPGGRPDHGARNIDQVPACAHVQLLASSWYPGSPCCLTRSLKLQDHIF
jgi:hypothetical protein